jgi:3-ketosteroid 9alpha-monooxygenase subunit A
MGTMSSPSDRGSALIPPGWHLLALASEVTKPVTGLALGSRALVAIRDRDSGKVRVFDGTCPHRGAHLGYGGRVTGRGSIVCPFHGKRIGLGEGTGRLCVREHETIDCGGAIFVRLSDVPAPDRGFQRVIGDILSTCELVEAVIGEAKVPPELIIENAFDFSHFPAVHLIPRISAPKVWLGRDGELNITTAFHTQAPDWETARGTFTSHFHARAFSPYLVVSELGAGETSRFVITGAAPASAGCVARIAIAVRPGESAETVKALVEGSKIAFTQDLLVWDHLDLDAQTRLDGCDTPVVAFRAYCASFTARRAGPEAGKDLHAPARELAVPGRDRR